MMLNAVAAYEYDPAGHVLLSAMEDKSFQDLSRRVQRSKTLDGGAVVADGGFSNSDRVITIKWLNTDENTHEAIARLFQLYTRLVVSVRDGVFLTSPDQYNPGPDTCTLQLLALEKLTS